MQGAFIIFTEYSYTECNAAKGKWCLIMRNAKSSTADKRHNPMATFISKED
jgi:hypothetical protein